jgi:hypothetical protein
MASYLAIVSVSCAGRGRQPPLPPNSLADVVVRQKCFTCYPGWIVPQAAHTVSSFCGRVRVWTPMNRGEGLGGVSVGVCEWISAKCVAATSTDEDGSFCLKPVKRGRYVAIVCKDGFATNVFEVEVTPQARERSVEILLELAS